MSGNDVTVFICISCKGQNAGTETPGHMLFRAVTNSLRALADNTIQVTPVDCLAVCKRPCTVALAAPGKWTYVVGDLDPEKHANDVIAAAKCYGTTDDGIVPWRERPQPFRKGVISRVPPLDVRLKTRDRGDA